MTCSNCNDRAGTPVTVRFPAEEKRVSVALCKHCRSAIEDAPRCEVERESIADPAE
ncbi:hypothetical protein [Salinarchaeum sp. Harcht-Bsk1]|uniref:hypothetical protein n=1 Tax=Salinarchaeum sp. Harcht-Bsk1 TaxID=1333523 RepID=UPI0016511E1F|nr:hypothetical protein [Salinarchaeum sp. Harcht-Bsk1]